MHKLASVAALASALLIVVSQSTSLAALKGGKAMEQEWLEVDDLLRRADSVELRKISPRVLRLAEWLLQEKGDAVARRYFEKGVEGNAWDLQQQLTLGELLARQGQPAALRQKAEMVLRVGEDDDVLRRATRLLGRPLPEEPTPFSKIKDTGPTLILAPVGDLSLFALHDLCAALSKRLPIDVRVASIEVALPAAARNFKTQWLTRTREQILATMREKPEARRQWELMGFTAERIRNSDAAVMGLVRKTTRAEQGAAGEEAFDAMISDYEHAKQWDVGQMLAALEPVVGDRLWSGLMVLGVTPLDLFGGKSNYLFGVAATGRYLGLISLHRFRAEFNGEAPKRERLIERALKQAFSSIGHMLGVPRCNTPECVRAYPQSLVEHDQKPTALCPECRAGMEKALGKKLPPD